MTPEEIRNTLDDDADRARSDLTVWRDRGLIIAAQQTRIAQLEAQIARVQTETLLEAAREIEATRSAKGIASRALDPGRAYAVAHLRSKAGNDV